MQQTDQQSLHYSESSRVRHLVHKTIRQCLKYKDTLTLSSFSDLELEDEYSAIRNSLSSPPPIGSKMYRMQRAHQRPSSKITINKHLIPVLHNRISPCVWVTNKVWPVLIGVALATGFHDLLPAVTIFLRDKHHEKFTQWNTTKESISIVH